MYNFSYFREGSDVFITINGIADRFVTSFQGLLRPGRDSDGYYHGMALPVITHVKPGDTVHLTIYTPHTGSKAPTQLCSFRVDPPGGVDAKFGLELTLPGRDGVDIFHEGENKIVKDDLASQHGHTLWRSGEEYEAIKATIRVQYMTENGQSVAEPKPVVIRLILADIITRSADEIWAGLAKDLVANGLFTALEAVWGS